MTAIQTAEFRRTGLLALEPSAFGAPFAIFLPPAEPFQLFGDVAVVDVAGPLTYDGCLSDCYRGIRARFDAALKSDAATVVVRYRSPGGEVSGAFDLARTLPQLAKEARKRYVAFTETQCQSAAYALASGADEIVLTDTANVGSVGVISVAVETTKADAAAGLHFEIFASGARKADGNPHQTWTEEARESAQAGIDASAEIFFELVAKHRGISAKRLEGASFMGEAAVAKGLADRVESWDQLLARLGAAGAAEQGATQSAIDGSSASAKDQMPKAEDPKDKDKEAKADSAWRKALKAAADDGDEKAKRALAAADEDEKKADEKPEPKDEKKDDAKSKAEFPSKKDDDKEEKKDEGKKAVAASADSDVVAGLVAQVAALTEAANARAAADEAKARAEFLATRPDLNEKLLAALATKPLAEVKAIVEAIPPVGNPLVPKLATVPVQGGAPASLDAKLVDPTMARVMGLTGPEDYSKVTVVDGVQTFGVLA